MVPIVSSVAEIEEAIAKLPPAEFRELLRRMKEREAEQWDRQIEEDAKSGRLEALYTRLMEEEGDQPKVPLDEVLDHPKLS
jgi:uncharacterized membrane protein